MNVVTPNPINNGSSLLLELSLVNFEVPKPVFAPSLLNHIGSVHIHVLHTLVKVETGFFHELQGTLIILARHDLKIFMTLESSGLGFVNEV